MRMSKLNKTIHKWLSLIVGIQLLIWLGTGLYFNLMDSSLASGNEYRKRVDQSIISYKKINPNKSVSVLDNNSTDNSGSSRTIIPLSKIISPIPQQVQLLWILQQPYYHFVYEKGAHSYQKRGSTLYDALTGRVVSLSSSQIKRIAKASYSGPGTVQEPKLQTPPFSDYAAQQNPMWQVQVNDKNNTSIYLDAVTGRVIRHVNDDSRLKALMLKLHFMDYGNSGGFNHWIIVLFAVVTLMLSMTGIVWLIEQIFKGTLRR